MCVWRDAVGNTNLPSFEYSWDVHMDGKYLDLSSIPVKINSSHSIVGEFEKHQNHLKSVHGYGKWHEQGKNAIICQNDVKKGGEKQHIVWKENIIYGCMNCCSMKLWFSIVNLWFDPVPEVFLWILCLGKHQPYAFYVRCNHFIRLFLLLLLPQK